MPHFPIPDISLGSVLEITPEFLGGHGIKLLLLDLDNTLMPYGQSLPSREMILWLKRIRNHSTEVAIFSNSHSKRPETVATELGIDFYDRAKKPFVKKLRKLLSDRALPPERVALAGDQIYTDVFCAKRAGILAIAVKPISLNHPLLALRYGLEMPFRAAYKIKRRYEK